MMKRLLLAIGFCALSAPAFAACGVTNLQVKDNAAVTAAVPYADDGSGASNCSPQIQIKQGGNVAAVTAGSALKTDASATTQPVSQAASSVASGAYSSGAFASGAFASGSIASGAMAAGSHAAGSAVDGWDLTQGAIADAAVTAGATGSVSAKLRSISRDVMTTNTWAGGTLGAMANYGTSPGAVLVPGVNAFVTNANPDGRATAANSSPVVPVAAASTAGAIQPNNTTAVVVKASAGTLFGVQLGNIGSGPAYLKIYNATSATCGSGTPVKRLIIPKAATAADGAGSNVTFGAGLAFGTGITYCVTTGIGDADTTAAAANTVLVNVDYE